MGWEIHTAKTAFAQFAEAWDQLNASLYDGHPLFDSRFMGPLLDHFGTGDERLCIHRTDAGISGALILCRGRIGGWSSFHPSQLQATPVEWAYEGGKFFLTQARPVTTMKAGHDDEDDGEPETQPVLLSRQPASPGVGVGVIRIAHDPHDIDIVKQGDVLVAEMTTALRLAMRATLLAHLREADDFAGVTTRLCGEHHGIHQALREGKGSEAADLVEVHIAGFYEVSLGA